MDGAEMIRQSTEHPPDNRRASRLQKDSLLGSNKGLTLIEVLVALTILAIGLLGVSLMQVMSITGNTFSREMAVATELAQDMLEKLQASTYTATAEDDALAGSVFPGTDHPTATDVANDLTPAVDIDGVLLPCNSTTNIVDERGLWPAVATTPGPLLYIRTWNVINDDPATDMKNIAVTVCWQEKGTTDRSVTISAVKVQE